MNSHTDIQRRLAAYCGGDLSPAENRQVELHLADCPDCCAELADLQTSLRLIRSTPEVDPPPWLTARIMANVREQQAEKRSWLQRIFFPLHIKLPLEAIALLMICVSGYYLSRSLESDLKQSPGQQFQEGPPGQALFPAQPPAQQPVRSEQPATAKPQPAVPPAATSQPVLQQENLPARTEQQIPARPVPSTYAPAPPAYRDKAESLKASPEAEFSNRVQEAAPEMKRKGSRSMESQGDGAAPAATGRAMRLPGPSALPQVVVRLSVDDPATALSMVREAVHSCGGTIALEPEPSEQRLTVRIATGRQKELLARLERLGRITERPLLPSGAELLELTIQW